MDTETKVKIKGEGFAKLGKEAEKAFSSKTAAGLQRAVRELKGDLSELLGTQIKLTREMRGLDRGSDSFKKFAKELKNVKDQATTVRDLMGDINKLTDPRRKRGQGFAAGLAQGTGLGQYIPTGPGMMPRMAGMGIGRMMRRGVGGIAAPFQSPGVGGFAGALGAIPFVGGAAGQMLMAGHGYFQQAVAFDRTSRQALFAQAPRLGRGAMETRRKIFDERARMVEAAGIRAAAANKPAARDISTILSGAASLVKDVRTFQKSGVSPSSVGAGAAAAGRLGTAGFGALIGNFVSNITKNPALQKKIINQATSDVVYGATLGKVDLTGEQVGKKLEGTRLGKLFYKGAKVAGATDRIQQVLDRRADIRETAERQAAALRAAGRRQPTGLPGAGFATSMGIAPTEMMGMFAEMMRARGGTFGDVKTRFLKTAMAGQVAYGISPQVSGGFGRMGMPGGGGTLAGGAANAYARAIGSATAIGLSGSMVAEYLQQLVEQGTRAEKMGVRFDPRSFERISFAMKGMGILGPQAGRMAGEMYGAGRRVAAGGIRGPADLLMMQAAGFRPGDTESYWGARNVLRERGMTPEIAQKYLGRVVQGAKQFQGAEAQKGVVWSFLQKAGIQAGPGMAGKLLGGFQGGQFTPSVMADIEAMTKKAAGKKPETIVEIATEKAKTGAGLAVYGAKAEAAQIGTGRALAGTYTALEEAGRAGVRTLSRFRGALTSAATTILKAMEKIDDLANALVPGTGGR
jgi:hypothetical protein